MKNLALQLFLLLVSLMVFPALFIVGFFYTTFKHFVKLDYSLNRQFTPIIRSIILLLDGLANAGGGELMNDLSPNLVFKYGKWFETISEVTGNNYVNGIDTKLRKVLDNVLGSKHCEESIK